MKCTKNPRLKNRGKAEALGRAFEINTEHIACLLYALHKLYPMNFYPKACRDYTEDYIATVKQFDCDNDGDVREYMIAQYLKDLPYLNISVAETIFARLKTRKMSRLDTAIYNEPNFAQLYAENILLLLIQLHYSNGFGEKRMRRVVAEWQPIDKPLEWLAEFTGAELSDDNEDAYKWVENIDRYVKDRDKPVATVREQLDARRHLEALRAYQEEMMK